MAHEVAITRSVLSDQVKGRLLEAILDGRYPPGARIVETRVAREFGTSQAPVREALRDLEALGVVEVTAFRGARVRHPSVGELLEAFEVRAVLETEGACLALGILTEEDLAALDGYLEQMRRAAEAQDPFAEATADAEFHASIMRLSGNATLERVWRTLEPFLRTYITIASSGVDRRAIADRHEPLVAALRKGDPDGVRAAIEHHFDQAARSLASVWVDPGADEPSSLPRPIRLAGSGSARGPQAESDDHGRRPWPDRH
jgi:DNA-binding GntR family transcriptional regulator